jgi:hypothetical protein
METELSYPIINEEEEKTYMDHFMKLLVSPTITQMKSIIPKNPIPTIYRRNIASSIIKGFSGKAEKIWKAHISGDIITSLFITLPWNEKGQIIIYYGETILLNMSFNEIYQIYRPYKENNKHVDLLKLIQVNTNGFPLICDFKLVINNNENDQLNFEYKYSTEIINLSEQESKKFKQAGHEYFIYQYEKIKLSDNIITQYPISSIFYIYPKTEQDINIKFESLNLLDHDSPIYDLSPSITSDELKLYTTEFGCLTRKKNDSILTENSNWFLWNHLLPKGNYSIVSNNDKGTLIFKYITALRIQYGIVKILFNDKIISISDVDIIDKHIDDNKQIDIEI